MQLFDSSNSSALSPNNLFLIELESRRIPKELFMKNQKMSGKILGSPRNGKSIFSGYHVLKENINFLASLK